MRTERHAPRWRPLLLLCLAAGGCASTGAPDRWLHAAADGPTDPYGAWVTVTLVKPHEDFSVAGEFLAVDADSLYVLDGGARPRDPVIGIPLAMIAEAKIASFDPQTGKASWWVVAGSLSTLSHGMRAAVTLPLWVIMGSALTADISRSPLEYYPETPWPELRMYARFPQGPPPDLHKLGLRPKSSAVRRGAHQDAPPDWLF